MQPYWDAEARGKPKRGRKPLAFDQMTTIDSHRDHLYAVDCLKRKTRPCIVIAASGMCSGGRIANYLKATISDPRTDLLFSVYEGVGTPGRAIQQYGPQGGYVTLDSKRYDIRARIHSISGYSAHADQKNLVNFFKRMRKRAKHVRLVHGEPDAQQALRTQLESLNITVDWLGTHNLCVPIYLFKNQKSLDVSVLTTHNVIDISMHHGGPYVSNYSTTP